MLLSLLSFFLCFVFGLLIGYLMKKRLKKVYKGPRSSKIRSEIHYEKDGTAFRFEPVIHVCPPNINQDDLSHSGDSDDSKDLED
jgi:hypothetical protein